MSDLPEHRSFNEHTVVLRKHRGVLWVAVLTSCFAAWLVLMWQTPVYEAKSKIYVSAVKELEANYYREITDWRKGDAVLTQSELAQTYPVLERVVKAAHLDERAEDYERGYASSLKRSWMNFVFDLRKRFGVDDKRRSMSESQRVQAAVEYLRDAIRVTPVHQTDLIELSVKDHNSETAAVLANILARSFVIFDLEQQLAEMRLKFGWENQNLLQIRDSIVNMNASLSGKILPTVDAIGPASIKVVEQASPPSSPAGPSRLVLYVFAVFGGLILGTGLAYFFDSLDPSFRYPSDVRAVFKSPILMDLTQKKLKGRNAIAAYADLAEQLWVALCQKDQRVLLVAGMENEHTSSEVMLRLGSALEACSGEKILLVDMGLREPSLHTHLEAKETPGLAQYLNGRSDISEIIQTTKSGMELVSAGGRVENPLSLLNKTPFVQVLEKKKSERIVLIYMPSIGKHRDLMLLGEKLPPILMVIRARRTKREHARSLVGELRARAVVLGTVISQ